MNKPNETAPEGQIDLSLRIPTTTAADALPGLAAHAATEIVRNLEANAPDHLRFLQEHLLGAAICAAASRRPTRQGREVRKFLRSMFTHSRISLRVTFTD